MISRKTSLRVGQPLTLARPRPSQANSAPNRTAQMRYPITGCCAILTSLSPSHHNRSATPRPAGVRSYHSSLRLPSRSPYAPDGQPLATTFMDYLLPTVHDIPDIEV